MPPSITSVRVVGSSGNSFTATVNRCDLLSELVDLVPAPFRPRSQELVNKIYRAAIKSNHARSYLATLERHVSDGTFPSEIEGRVHTPSLQISKEYLATGDCKSAQAALDNATLAHKKAMLTQAISLKKAEVAYLQSLFTETYYKSETELIYKDVATQLAADAGLELDSQGMVPKANMPSWMKSDCETFMDNGLLFPQRAVAIAYMAVQKEMSKKFKSLSLKRQVDQDVEMQDTASKSDTISSIIRKEIDQFRKELKQIQPGNGKGPRTKKAKPNPKPQTQKVTKVGTGKGKGNGGKKPQGKPRS